MLSAKALFPLAHAEQWHFSKDWTLFLCTQTLVKMRCSFFILLSSSHLKMHWSNWSAKWIYQSIRVEHFHGHLSCLSDYLEIEGFVGAIPKTISPNPCYNNARSINVDRLGYEMGIILNFSAISGWSTTKAALIACSSERFVWHTCNRSAHALLSLVYLASLSTSSALLLFYHCSAKCFLCPPCVCVSE